jgi:hypothetical protein
MHFYDNAKDAKKLASMVGKDNRIGSEINKKDDKHTRYEVFEAIDYLVSSARSLYCDDQLDWDTIVNDLSEAVLKLKGKEGKLKAMADDGEYAEEVPTHG